MEYNIVRGTNEAASWYREPMIRGVVVKGYLNYGSALRVIRFFPG